MIKKVKSTCESCTSHQRLLWFNDNGVAEIEHICTYLEKPLTAEEIKEACDAYEEAWD